MSCTDTQITCSSEHNLIVHLLHLNLHAMTYIGSKCREKLAGKDIDDLLHREPLMLTANLKYALQELTRMLPDKDPAEFLFKHPGMVLTMDEQMMGSSIDGNLTKS